MVQTINGSPSGLMRSLYQSQTTQETASQRIASGKQVNSASDNAAGVAIINRLVSQNEGFQQAIRNAVDGVSYAQVESGNLSSITEGVQRIRELSLQAANGILSDNDRSSLQAEVSQLQEGIANQLKDAQFNGVKLFTKNEGVSFQVGEKANQTIELSTKDFTESIEQLTSINISTQAGAQAAVGGLDDFLQEIGDRQGELGAITNRLDSTVNNLYNSSVNSEQARSRIQDADIAKEVTDNIRGSMQQEVGLALQAQANANSGRVLQLLASIK